MRPYDPILYPFSLLYDGITRFRNRLFDIGKKKSVSFAVPTVVVGNLSLGGTGKTPMVEFLIAHFKMKHQISILSRGYGRKTTGFVLAKDSLTTQDIGDEPFQVYKKYGKEVTVAVGEERILAIPRILAEKPETDLILLDDAFQHRYVKGDFNLLLTTFQKPFFKDKILPMGTLREHPNGAKRADAVVVTKCPETITPAIKAEYEQKIRAYAGEGCPVVFSGLKYGVPYNVLKNGRNINEKIILVSGIANNRLLKEEIKKKYELLEVLEFPDHHKYTLKDVANILAVYSRYESLLPAIITTEKDAVKLNDDKFLQYLREIPIFALPVEIYFNQNEGEIVLALIAKAISEKQYKSEN